MPEIEGWTYPIPVHRRGVYSFYKLAFRSDGCPVKRTEKGDVFHPILPPYLIKDYVRWAESSGCRLYLKYAVDIARVSLKQAQGFDNALVFMYEPGTALSILPNRFYSALTQAWYIDALCALRKHVGDEFDRWIIGIYRSLLIPVEQGGVLLKKSWGWTVEEYPHAPPLYTLNGWLTVLCMLFEARDDLKALGVDVSEFMDKNLKAVESLLPLYDAGFVANSRYQLSGFTRLRIQFDRPVTSSVSSFLVSIPGEGTYAGTLCKVSSRWFNYVERFEPKLLQFNIIQSLVSFPKPNIFKASVSVDVNCSAKVYLAKGTWRPDLSALPTTGWRELTSLQLVNGCNEIQIPLAWDSENAFAYPTNFKKRVNGVFFNAYHFVHIQALAQLFSRTRREVFRKYSLRWLDYTKRWGSIPEMQGYELSFLPLKGEETLGLITRLLNPPSERSS